MDTDEFEALVEGSEESQTLEYKGPCNWSIRTFVKDILALSNVQDGGFIIIGFENRTLRRLGLSEAQIATYDVEQMQDQMANYADPFVTFTRYVVDGKDDKKYVVIRVSEFPEIPVVSRADGHDVRQGVVYYRTRRRRPASEPVTTSYDMRDILDRAGVKLMAKRSSQGYRVENDETNHDYYARELGDL